MSNLYNTIVMLCNKRGINVTEMCRASGVNRSSLGDIKQGRKKTLSASNLSKIADYFGVTIEFLLGKTTSVETNGKISVPVYGRIAAGFPSDMVADIEDYEEISAEMAKNGEYFCLRIHGDSMSPLFVEGDVIVIRKQETCEDNDICAVAVNGEYATCKRVLRVQKGILLVAENEAYEPMFFSNKQIENLPVAILGKVVELRRKF